MALWFHNRRRRRECNQAAQFKTDAARLRNSDVLLLPDRCMVELVRQCNHKLILASHERQSAFCGEGLMSRAFCLFRVKDTGQGRLIAVPRLAASSEDRGFKRQLVAGL